jgi:hypothetical protein
MSRGRSPGEVRLLGRSATVGTCWTVGMCFALADAVTTWYGLEVVGLHEGNPIAQWAISELGLGRALALRVLVGAIVLGLIAVGTFIRLPHHQQLVNRACRFVLIWALAFWGVVAFSNTFQIAFLRLG